MRANCHSCRHNSRETFGNVFGDVINHCKVTNDDAHYNPATYGPIMGWIGVQSWNDECACSPDADGCPGYEPLPDSGAAVHSLNTPQPDPTTPTTAETTLRALLELLPDSSPFEVKNWPELGRHLLSDWNTTIEVRVAADELDEQFNATLERLAAHLLAHALNGDLAPREGWPAALEEAAQANARADAAEAEVKLLRAEVERLRVLGPDTDARVVVEARAIAADMLQPALASWKACAAKAAKERDRLHAELATLRQGWQAERDAAERAHDLLIAERALAKRSSP